MTGYALGVALGAWTVVAFGLHSVDYGVGSTLAALIMLLASRWESRRQR